MFDSRDVAAYIAQQCDDRDIGYNNTKIQKLLYCAYGGLLAWKNVRICNEYPRVWQYGPVFPKVFSYIHKGHNIARYSEAVAAAQDENARDVRQIVSSVLSVFGAFSASKLSAWTHRPGSPWDRVVNGDDETEGAGLYGFIPDEYIKEYFARNVMDEKAITDAA